MECGRGVADERPGTGLWRLGVAGSGVMGVTFGMARYAYGLTLPAVRDALHPSELVLGLIGSGTFAGFLTSLLAAPRLARWKGPRAPTTVGAASATLGCALVASAASPAQLASGALVAGSAAGWVWASYSTIAAAIAPATRLPRLLGVITTGAAAGLIVVGILSLVVDSWRWTWSGIAFVAAGATLVNLWFVPPLPSAPRPARPRRRVPIGGELIGPTVFAVVLFVSAAVYFTYATDAAESGGLGRTAGPLIFVIVGASGLTGLAAGALAEKAGARSVAIVALVLLGGALVLLGLAAGSLPLVLVSAVLFGSANTVGSAALPIWTAILVPDHAAAAFTATLLTGSVSATVAPTLVGALVPVAGLRGVLLAAAILSAGTAASLALTRHQFSPSPPRSPRCRARPRGGRHP